MGFLRDRCHPFLLVATHQVNLNALLLQLLHGFPGVGLEGFGREGRLGEGAGFVDNHSIYLAYLFQGGGIFDEDVFLCRFANAHHEGCRCGKSHCTGTGYHQDTDCREYGLRQVALTTDEIPGEECQQGNATHCRYEDKCNPIDHPLHGRLGTLCLLHHAYHIGKHRLLADFFCFETEGALADYRSSQHLVTNLLLHGNRFARHG